MTTANEPTREQLARRLERERNARHAAEKVSEEATTRLYTAMEELKSLNATMRDFVAIASHDLKTPIASISGFADLLSTEWDAIDDDTKRQYIGIIERSAGTLIHLVDDLLTISRIEAGALDTHKQVIELRDAVSDAIRNFLDHSSDICVQIASEARVEADPDHLMRILVNYLGNAIKYGAPPYEVDAKRTDGWVEIRVRDHGDGVPEDFVPQLFGRFARAEKVVKERVKGTGLGLSIVKGLAQANGGEAWYEPNEPEGSCFVVRLPIAA